MWMYHDMPFVYNPDCMQYNKEKMEEHATQVVQQYNENKRFKNN